jgi:hypothetical protein
MDTRIMSFALDYGDVNKLGELVASTGEAGEGERQLTVEVVTNPF